jgi:hypothetical protein
MFNTVFLTKLLVPRHEALALLVRAKLPNLFLARYQKRTAEFLSRIGRGISEKIE